VKDLTENLPEMFFVSTFHPREASKPQPKKKKYNSVNSKFKEEILRKWQK